MRVVVLFSLWAGSLLGQIQPDALQMIERSASALQRFQSGEIETENTGIYARTSKPLTIKAWLAWSTPDRVRLTIGSETAGETTISSNGILTRYSKLPNEYLKEDGALPLAIAQSRAFAGVFSLRAGNPDLVAARVLRDEQFSADNVRLDCSVIEVKVGAAGATATRSYLLWVDKQTGVPVKQQLTATRDEGGKRIESASSFVVRRMLLDVPVDEKLFEFHPPSGSRLIASPSKR